MNARHVAQLAGWLGIVLLAVFFRFGLPTGDPPASVEPEASPDTVVVRVFVRDTVKKTPPECLQCHAVGISAGSHP